jgi:hypothetical protein
LKKILRYLKDNHWQSIFFTGKLDEYSRVKYKLTSNGIKTKTKIISNRERSGIGTFGRNGVIGTFGGNQNEYYQIYVKSKDIELANQCIYSS